MADDTIKVVLDYNNSKDKQKINTGKFSLFYEEKV